jgi:hypothetical protein
MVLRAQTGIRQKMEGVSRVNSFPSDAAMELE